MNWPAQHVSSLPKNRPTDLTDGAKIHRDRIWKVIRGKSTGSGSGDATTERTGTTQYNSGGGRERDAGDERQIFEVFEGKRPVEPGGREYLRDRLRFRSKDNGAAI